MTEIDSGTDPVKQVRDLGVSKLFGWRNEVEKSAASYGDVETTGIPGGRWSGKEDTRSRNPQELENTKPKQQTKSKAKKEKEQR